MNRQKKIKLLVVGPYPPPYSGPESSMKLFLESPIRDKCNIRFLNMNFRKDNSKRGKVDLTSFIMMAFLLFRFIWQLIVFRPDLIYYYVTATITGWLLKDIWIIGLSWIFHRKIVIHMRAGHFRKSLQTASAWKRNIIVFFLRKASIGIVQANCLKDQFHGILPDKKIKAVYNMIDVERFQRTTPYNDAGKRVFFMGHLTFAKGYSDLLLALPEIVAAVPDVKLVCAGIKIKGKERNVQYNLQNGQRLTFIDPEECFEQHVRGKCDKNYEYLGLLNEEEKIAQLESCRVFVLPSYSEGFSMAVLEAMCMGLPVVTTPVGALKEIVKTDQNGMVVDCGNPHQLAAAIIKLLHDQDLCKAVHHNNTQYVRENFSQEIISSQLFQIFSDLISI